MIVGWVENDFFLTGSVVQVVAAGSFPEMFPRPVGAVPRDHESYLVLGGSTLASSTVYWPEVSKLRPEALNTEVWLRYHQGRDKICETVRAQYPQATAQEFRVGGWEIYETGDTEHSYVLGSGLSLPTTPEQDESGYRLTEDAAWDDAARSVRAYLQFKAVADDIVKELAYIIQGGSMRPDKGKFAALVVARKILDAQEGVPAR